MKVEKRVVKSLNIPLYIGDRQSKVSIGPVKRVIPLEIEFRGKRLKLIQVRGV